MRGRGLCVAMVVGICGLLVSGKRMLFEVGEKEFDGFLELRVMAVAHGFGIQFDFDIRSYALVFDFPFIVGSPESAARSGNDTAVHQCLERAEESNETAPGALADQRADVSLA